MPICSMHKMEKRIKWSKYSTFVAVSVNFYPYILLQTVAKRTHSTRSLLSDVSCVDTEFSTRSARENSFSTRQGEFRQNGDSGHRSLSIKIRIA